LIFIMFFFKHKSSAKSHGSAPVDRSRLASELNQLLAHARQAYANGDRFADGSPSPRRATDLLRSALDEITGSRELGVAAVDDPAAPMAKTDTADRGPPRSPSPSQERRASREPRSAEQIAAALRRMAGGDIPWFFVDEDGGTDRWLEHALVTGNRISNNFQLKIDRHRPTVPFVAVSGNPGSRAVFEGDGSPEGIVAAPFGSLFMRIDEATAPRPVG
jgi:hypothetical protein